MPDDKDKKEPFAWRKTPDDMTPVEPFVVRRRSSQSAMNAIGWHDCPSCKDNKDMRSECTLCWDEETKTWSRKVPIDVLLKWNREHPK